VRPAALLASLVLVPSALAGAQPGQPPELPAVVVRDSALEPERALDEEAAFEETLRSPGSVGFVGEERIERSRATDLEDVLQETPGVLVRSRGVGEEPRISIRGSGLRNNFHTRGVNVLIDGFAFQNADGFSDVESFELLATKRIEVYKGAGSLRFGGGALGGAINLVTRTAEDSPLVFLRNEVGSFDFWKTYASTGLETGWGDLFGAFSHSQNDGFREHAEGDRQRLYGSFGRDLAGGSSLRFDLNLVRNRAELPGALTPAEFQSDPSQADPASVAQDAARDYEYARGALLYHRRLSETRTLEALGQFNYQDLWHPLPFAIIDNETGNATAELRYVGVDPLFGRGNRLSAGVQGAYMFQPQVFWQNLAGEQGAKTLETHNQAGNLFVYAEDEWHICESLALVLGARTQVAWRSVDDELENPASPATDGSQTYAAFSPRLGLLYQVLPTLQLFANASQAYEPPILAELTAPGNVPGEVGDLDAQKAWQLEIGARGELWDRLVFDVALYDMELRDEIRNLNVAPFPGAPFTIPRYENIDDSRHWGVEVGLDLRLLEGLHLDVAYTYSDFRYADDPSFGDNELPGEPPHFAAIALRFEHASGFWIAPGVEVASDYYADSANMRRVDGFALVNTRLGFDHARSGLSFFFEARNLADRDFVSVVLVDTESDRYIEPGDGRAFYGGLAWRWR
jgi:iron complex outermembrane receptor protein